jgi:hypothetical protein
MQYVHSSPKFRTIRVVQTYLCLLPPLAPMTVFPDTAPGRCLSPLGPPRAGTVGAIMKVGGPRDVIE